MACQDCAYFSLCPWLRTDPQRGQDKGWQLEENGTGSLDAETPTTELTVDGEASGFDNTKKAQSHGGQMSLNSDDDEAVVRTYRRRWVMLGVFCLFSISNAYMWIHLNIIANVVLRYYNQSLPADSLQQETAVDWLSLVYMLLYLVCIPLGMYILDKFGLRVNNMVGCTINALGAWLKCAAVSPTRFPVLMTAQTLCGTAQTFIVSIPPRLAAVWFGPDEVSTATAIGVFGNQVGVAVGFLVPPIIVPNSPDLSQIGHDLTVMFYAGACICTLLLLLMLLVFQSRPPHAPSRAQLLMMKSRPQEMYLSSLVRLLKSVDFLLLMISYGLNAGSYYAISTLLNAMVLHYFPGEEITVGQIGLTIILTGIAGSIVAGVWLDKTKYFKSTSVAIFLLSAMGMFAFTFTLNQGQIWIVFLTSGLLGFFMTGYLPVGYEFAAEITYPEPEGTACGLLTSSAMMFGIVMTLGMRTMMNQVSIMAANIFVSCVLLVGTVLTACIRSRYYRQEAEKNGLCVGDITVESSH